MKWYCLPCNTFDYLVFSFTKTFLVAAIYLSGLQAAEDLYLSGYLSYPRTESTSYPASFDIRDALATQAGGPDEETREYARALLRNGYARPRDGVDAGDHPPITPVGAPSSAGIEMMGGDKGRLYDLVVKHFLATVSEDAIFMSTKVVFVSENSGETFCATGKREIRAGYVRSSTLSHDILSVKWR
jgi:DNA topoisomerase-3